jgi:hypothetical protein
VRDLSPLFFSLDNANSRSTIGSFVQSAVHLLPSFAHFSPTESTMQNAKKILLLTYPFVVATEYLVSKLRAILLWESERENSHLKGFPFYGGTKFPPKASIST